ncbi:MAG: DNA methyltransferase [Candidatus Hodarchaeales archaeon]|jgi:DNA modification methylase
MKDSGSIDPRNKLNALSGKEWIRFTKSWFIADGKSSDISREIDLHPASFPPSMIEDFINFFTKPGEKVLDPFLGTGSTLVACENTGRKGVGIELYPKYAKTAKSRTNFPVLEGDLRKLLCTLDINSFSLCITSPPYWRILKKKKDYNQQERLEKGLDLQYGQNPLDLGMIEDKEEFLKELTDTFYKIHALLTEGAHLIVFIQNVRDKGEMIPLAFELPLRLKKWYSFLGERVWLQNQKTLRPYGYPYSFVSNVHHHFALIFKKRSQDLKQK